MQTEKRNVVNDVTNSMKQVKGSVIWRLLKNPLDSLYMTEKDLVYGILGLASSFAGFLIWVLLIGRKLTSLFYSLMPFGGEGIGGLFSPRSITSEIFGKMFLAGLLSILALLAALWLIGWWRGGVKPSIKQFVIRIGSMQYIGGAGFILAGLLAFNFSLSFAVLLITVLSLFTLSLYGGIEASGVSRERAASYLICSAAAYIVFIGILIKLVF